LALGVSALGLLIVAKEHDGGASLTGGILGILLGAAFLIAACLHWKCGDQIRGGFAVFSRAASATQPWRCQPTTTPAADHAARTDRCRRVPDDRIARLLDREARGADELLAAHARAQILAMNYGPPNVPPARRAVGREAQDARAVRTVDGTEQLAGVAIERAERRAGAAVPSKTS
jgi:hypothetical protein